MDYYEICVSGNYQEDLLTGLLSEFPFESFMEKEDVFCAYIQAIEYDIKLLNEIRKLLSKFDLSVEAKLVPAQNWNTQWESNFDPVIIKDFCAISADFHHLDPGTRFHLKINPRMAFGTGHHETTWMMIEQMKQLVIEGESIFDYGTGTGVLAILAEQMGASVIHGIDFDANAIENSVQNAAINDCTLVEFQQCELKDFETNIQYDIILANINYPVLMENAQLLKTFLHSKGHLLISGIMIDFSDRIIDAYSLIGFELSQKVEKGEWSSMLFELIN